MTDYEIYCQRLRDVGVDPLPYADWLLESRLREGGLVLEELINWIEAELED